ncbi:MAG: elongation of very long chain fatty acids protein [Sphingobacteriales bacterium]|nr:MAG: elongation of very long chain fatty acids protein [Sphingobacteriales bacterium]
MLDAMQRNNYVLPVICVLAYLLLCFMGPRVMAERKAFGLDKSLAAWNLFLALFSAYGAIRTVPHMLNRVATLPFEQTVCEHPFAAYGAGACGLASVLFIVSKIPELIDTVFIVLRKKPLIFLHWYHHVTVLIFCWNSYVTTAGAGLYFISMNYTVHAVMYFYYFMQAVKMIPRWFPSWLITLMQISQMIIGTGIVCASFYYYFQGGDLYKPGECNNQPSNLAAGGIIYASYLYLFVEFALKRFLFGEKPAASKKVKKAD